MLIYTGLYSSAISVSQDLTLCQSIEQTAMEQSKFLESMGTAQMESELQTRVLKTAKKPQTAWKKRAELSPR